MSKIEGEGSPRQYFYIDGGVLLTVHVKLGWRREHAFGSARSRCFNTCFVLQHPGASVVSTARLWEGKTLGMNCPAVPVLDA